MVGPGGRDSVSGSLILKQPWGTAITKRPDRETPRRAEPSQDGGQVAWCVLGNGVCLVPDMISFLKSLLKMCSVLASAAHILKLERYRED